MLHPSYTELMERINKDVEEGDTPIVQSRYSIVKATADRAKQIIDARSVDDKIAKQIKNEPNHEPVISDSQHLTKKKGSPLIDGNTDDMKPLSIAIEELYAGYVKISERAESDEVETDAEDENVAELDAEISSETNGEASSENTNNTDDAEANIDSGEEEAHHEEDTDDDDDDVDEDEDDKDDDNDKEEDDDDDEKSSEEAEDDD